MRNFENNYNDQTRSRNTGWESIEDNELERRRVANRRYEAIQKSEKARASIIKKIKTLAIAAILTTAVVGAVAANGCSTHEIMDDPNRTGNVEVINVESVTLTDGPNIRKDPVIPNKEDGSTVLIDFGEEGQTAQIPYQGTVYYYDNEYGSNGDWYGFPAEEFSNKLFWNAFLSQREAERLVEMDDDGVVWINGDYVAVERGKEVQN